MPAIGKITLDAKEYDAVLARVQRNTLTATSTMAKGAGDAKNALGKAGGVLNALGGAASSAGGKLGQLGQILGTFAAGKLSILAAGIGVIVAQISDLWDRATLSAEEYAHKTELAAERANRAWDKLQGQHKTDNGYMDRLVDLAQKEQLSNAAKNEAARLITMLTSRYGDLGISIDKVTGSITGADAAQAKLLEKMRQQSMEALQRKLSSNFAQTRAAAKDAMDEKIDGSTLFRWTSLGSQSLLAYENRLHVDKYLNSVTDLQKMFADFSRLRDKATTKDEIDKWQKVVDLIEKRIEMEQQLQRLRESGVASESEEAARLRRETEKAQKKTDFFTDEKKSIHYQHLINDNRRESAEIQKLINDLKRQGVELTEDEARAIIWARQELAGETQAADMTKQLQQQIRIKELAVSGKREEARMQELIYNLIKGGAAVPRDQVNEIMKLKQRLGELNLQEMLQNDAKSLYERALRMFKGDRAADRYAALERARQERGSELTDKEKAWVLKLLAMTEKLNRIGDRDHMVDLSGQVNSLTARGGGGGRAVANTLVERYQVRMQKLTEDGNTILRDIRNTIHQRPSYSGGRI